MSLGERQWDDCFEMYRLLDGRRMLSMGQTNAGYVGRVVDEDGVDMGDLP